MIIFFGPAGAGKSVQGQVLAARQGWRWISSGQLLRDTHNMDIITQQQTGGLIDSEQVNGIIEAALDRASNVGKVILDGFPRTIEQAEWLVKSCNGGKREISLAIVLEVPRAELIKRLEIRGRVDDTLEAIDSRLQVYRKEIYPILNYFTEQNIRIAHIDGVGTVGQVHDKIMEELQAIGLLAV
jgi:adenylate kinase